jgi:hypothetical protein
LAFNLALRLFARIVVLALTLFLIHRSCLELKKAFEVADCRAIGRDVRIGAVFDRIRELVAAPGRQG